MTLRVDHRLIQEGGLVVMTMAQANANRMNVMVQLQGRDLREQLLTEDLSLIPYPANPQWASLHSTFFAPPSLPAPVLPTVQIPPMVIWILSEILMDEVVTLTANVSSQEDRSERVSENDAGTKAAV